MSEIKRMIRKIWDLKFHLHFWSYLVAVRCMSFNHPHSITSWFGGGGKWWTFTSVTLYDLKKTKPTPPPQTPQTHKTTNQKYFKSIFAWMPQLVSFWGNQDFCHPLYKWKLSQWDHLWVYCIQLLKFIDMVWVFFQMRKTIYFHFQRRKNPNH